MSKVILMRNNSGTKVKHTRLNYYLSIKDENKSHVAYLFEGHFSYFKCNGLKERIELKDKFSEFLREKNLHIRSDMYHIYDNDIITNLMLEFNNKYNNKYNIVSIFDEDYDDENDSDYDESSDPNNEESIGDDENDHDIDEDESSNNEQSGEDYDNDSSSDYDDSSSDDNDSSSDYDDFSGEFYDDINYYVSSYKYSNDQKPVTRSDTRNELLKKNNTSNNIYENQLRRSPRLNKNLNTVSSNDNFIKKNSTQSKNIINIKVIVKNSNINNADLGDKSCDKLINKLSSQLKMLNI